MTGRFNFNTSAQVSRQSYAGNPGKSTYTASESYYGYFAPVDSDSNLIGIQTMGQAYQFQTEADADIKASDKLTIDGVVYIVRGVRKYDYKRQYFLDCVIELPEKNA